MVCIITKTNVCSVKGYLQYEASAQSCAYLQVWLADAGTNPHELVQHGPSEGLKAEKYLSRFM